MEPDKQLLEAWEKGVALGDAWWAFADLQKKKRFRELQQAASPADPAPHMGFRHSLEDEVIGRLSSGELQAFGIEYRSAGEPIAIPKNYFWKRANIDFDNNTVAALGRKFGQVTVHGERAPLAENLPEIVAVDPLQFQTELNFLHVGSAETEPEGDPGVVNEAEASAELGLSYSTSQEFFEEKQRGRPTKLAEIEQAIDILLAKGVDLASMPRPKAYKAIKKCAEIELKSNTKIGFSESVIQRALFRRFDRRH
jgi:hypothetical protein